MYKSFQSQINVKYVDKTNFARNILNLVLIFIYLI